MAFHDRLSLAQRILLGILCFPLLPFYLCYVCCCASDGKNDDDVDPGHKPGRTGKAKADAVDGFSDLELQKKQTVEKEVNGTDERVTVQIHPERRTPELPKRFSFGKGKDVRKNEVAYKNEGFVEDDNKAKLGRKTEYEPQKKQTVEKEVNGTAERVTVQIHPERRTPKLPKRFSFGKGKDVRKNEVAYKNEGFVEDDSKAKLGRKTEYAFPWDRSNLKSMYIDLDNFKHIDAYASKVRTRDTVEALVQELLKGTKSDIEKLRAIWMWVTHHIGIECQEVSGYSKGGMYKVGARFSGDATHAWNAVRLDGKWHLLDSTWGAGNTNDNHSTFKFEYNEFYFLTHPALFVADHFPVEGKWQLLNPQVSLKQFENSIRLRSAFYNLGLLSINPETNIIQSDGKTTITVKSSCPVLFMHNLNGKQRDGLMTLTPDGMKLDIYPQQTGKHSLDIFAKASSSGDEGKYSHVCEYQLQCKAVSRDMSIPEKLSNPVGPSWLTERKGLSQPSQRSPIVHASDGRCSFGFRLAGHLDVMATLSTTSFSMPDDERRRHIFQSRRGDRVDFRLQLPRPGLYVFGVYGKDKAETGSYSFLCNYLISCTNPTVRWPVFPLVYATWKEDYELVEPLAGILPANREVQFKMRIPDVSMVSVGGRDTRDLVLDADGFWTGHCSTVGCTDLNVMIKVNPSNRTRSFVLNYQVESH